MSREEHLSLSVQIIKEIYTKLKIKLWFLRGESIMYFTLSFNHKYIVG